MKTPQEWRQIISIFGHPDGCVCNRCKNGFEMFPTDEDLQAIQSDARAELLTENAALREVTKAAQTFVDRCNRGEVRSVKSKAAFEKALQTLKDLGVEI